jgi:DNA-directed RNA polymerase subunit RPC12/RpoP
VTLLAVAGFTFHRGSILEYTDAPPAEIETGNSETYKCSQCGHTLPKEVERCDRCGTVRMSKPETAEGKASDAVAVLLSVVPGLGHVYKGYRVLGLLFVIGAGFALLIGALAATATAGFGLALIPIYWIGVMFHVYAIKDQIAPGSNDVGEQY